MMNHTCDKLFDYNIVQIPPLDFSQAFCDIKSFQFATPAPMSASSFMPVVPSLSAISTIFIIARVFLMLFDSMAPYSKFSFFGITYCVISYLMNQIQNNILHYRILGLIYFTFLVFFQYQSNQRTSAYASQETLSFHQKPHPHLYA